MERYPIHEDAGIYYVTMLVIKWLPVFVSEQACRIVTDSLNHCHQHKKLRINAYLIMPTHLHAIVFLERFDPEALRDTLIEFRKFTGRQLSDFCCEHMPHCFAEALRDASGDDRARRFWQPTFHPEGIESDRFYQQKLDYLHDNPRRKGLVLRAEHRRFSSASYWMSEGKVANDVVLSKLEW